jgi:cytochrome c-type biogenesis protein CcmH
LSTQKQTEFEIKRQLYILFIAVIALLGTAAVILPVRPAVAQQPTPAAISDDQVNAVAKGLYCPVCENIPLDVCPTQACAQWRDLIKEKLAAGWTSQQIKDYFVQQYGDRVLAEPPRRGLNWLVYVLPPLFFLIGLFLVVRTLRNMQAAAPATGKTPVAVEPADDPYVRRLEEELEKKERYNG